MRLELGKPVRCSDGAVGELADVVIDSSSKRVTHLVVQTEDQPEAARLVPVALGARLEDGRGISLTCTAEALDLTILIARKDPCRHPRVAARWLQRYLEECDEATIEEAAMVAA
jgi:hypothetical protein